MLSIAELACIEAAWRRSLLRQIALPWSQGRMRLWHELTCWMGVFPETELRPERFLASMIELSVEAMCDVEALRRFRQTPVKSP